MGTKKPLLLSDAVARIEAAMVAAEFELRERGWSHRNLSVGIEYEIFNARKLPARARIIYKLSTWQEGYSSIYLRPDAVDLLRVAADVTALASVLQVVPNGMEVAVSPNISAEALDVHRDLAAGARIKEQSRGRGGGYTIDGRRLAEQLFNELFDAGLVTADGLVRPPHRVRRIPIFPPARADVRDVVAATGA